MTSRVLKKPQWVAATATFLVRMREAGEAAEQALLNFNWSSRAVDISSNETDAVDGKDSASASNEGTLQCRHSQGV